MSKNEDDSVLPKHSEPQPGASVLVRSEGGDVTVSFSDGSESLTMNRRDFMRVSGAAAATAAMSSAACREPQREITPYVDRPDEVSIGNTREYAGVCNGCASQCGIRIKSRAGRPIKLEGNPEHPVNEGTLCARGQSSYMNLYDPDRRQQPLRPDGEGGTEISWEELDEEVAESVEQARNGASVRFLTGAINGPATQGLLDEIVDQLPDAAHYEYEPLASDAVLDAAEEGYNEAHLPHYRFDRADLVVSLGSDFLGTWLSPVEFTRGFSSGRDFDEAEEEFDGDDSEHFDPQMNRLVSFEPAISLTGINADDRHRVRPDRLVYVALALANELFSNHSPDGIPAGAVRGALSPFDVESVAEILGDDVDADTLRELASDLADHAGRSVVVAGGTASATETGIALESAVNLLNVALENDGETVDRARVSKQSAPGASALVELLDEIEAGDVDILIVDGAANPVYASPAGLDVASAIEQVDTVISSADRINETARYADLLATGCHFLESWGDSNPQTGIFAIQQPAILPLYDNRPFENSLLQWFGDAEHSPELAEYLEVPERPEARGGEHGEGKPYDPGPFYRYLRAWWRENIYGARPITASFEQFWLDVLREGVYEDPERVDAAYRFNPLAAVQLLPDGLPDADEVDYGSLADKTVHLFETIPMHDGRHANNGHLQELPEPLTKNTWGSFAMIGYQTFQAAGLETGQQLEISTDDGASLRFPVIAMPGMHENVIALSVGYGRTAAGTVGNDIGENAFRLAEVTDDGVRYSGLSADIRATNSVEEMAITDGAGVLDVDDRRVLGVASLDEYAEDQNAGVYESPLDYSLWPEHDFGDLKWGMSIDLTKCTGCSACVTACQEENNIPVVGKQGVLEGREMHWMRIDRYYRLPEEAEEAREGLTGDPMHEDNPLLAFGDYIDEDPRVLMQPMLCQHCDKAPCESVCPVAATTQSEDGLNQMAYQRCVGTRYCSNNCPYKVRRYNWFNYGENREESFFASLYPELKEHGRLNQEEPLQMGYNPDVTIRSRGVMEKCTFCVQRIRRGKWKIAEEGRRQFEDGEVVTACQETCPADAIEFGNVLDDDHKVSRMHRRKRAMKALDDLSTEPAVAYMTSIWNTDEELDAFSAAHGGGEHGDDGHGDEEAHSDDEHSDSGAH